MEPQGLDCPTRSVWEGELPSKVKNLQGVHFRESSESNPVHPTVEKLPTDFIKKIFLRGTCRIWSYWPDFQKWQATSSIHWLNGRLVSLHSRGPLFSMLNSHDSIRTEENILIRDGWNCSSEPFFCWKMQIQVNQNISQIHIKFIILFQSLKKTLNNKNFQQYWNVQCDIFQNKKFCFHLEIYFNFIKKIKILIKLKNETKHFILGWTKCLAQPEMRIF